jgi:hypothetical protein
VNITARIASPRRPSRAGKLRRDRRTASPIIDHGNISGTTVPALHSSQARVLGSSESVDFWTAAGAGGVSEMAELEAQILEITAGSRMFHDFLNDGLEVGQAIATGLCTLPRHRSVQPGLRYKRRLSDAVKCSDLHRASLLCSVQRCLLESVASGSRSIKSWCLPPRNHSKYAARLSHFARSLRMRPTGITGRLLELTGVGEARANVSNWVCT